TITAMPIHIPFPFVAGAEGAAEGALCSSIEIPGPTIYASVLTIPAGQPSNPFAGRTTNPVGRSEFRETV
ncbi:MAG TPA: hypothetical protein VI999_05855, partial [Thermoplasmata archaeon]|nr:hypothetical protein [Thermoplasmata archaeon]